MNRLPRVLSRKRGAALLIVLAFVVLLTGVGVAYLTRTTADRQVADSSLHQSTVDQLAQSAMDNVIGDIRKEIVDGSTAVTVNETTIHTPTLPAYAVPQRSGNPNTVPNLIRRSIANDQILFPGSMSRASPVNSTMHASANGRSVTPTRWNSHYLVPKDNPLSDDSVPIGDFANATPDWVFVVRDPNDPYREWRKVIGDPDQTVVGRFAYAVYDEGGLLDVNLAGYPTDPSAAPLPTQRVGRKGSLAYADLGALPYPIPNGPPPVGAAYQVDKLVGWRNYATTQPTNNFPDSDPPGQAFARNFQTDSAPATNFYNFVRSPANAFLTVRSDITFNDRTDQMFLTRQELLAFRATTGFSANALQYLSTFSRELNAPSWAPTLNASDMGGNDAGGIYAYATNADSSTTINPNLLNVRVANSFTRADGTTAALGELLINRRFPLTRLIAITPTGPNTTTNSTIIRGVFQPATATANNQYPELPAGGTIQRDFGLVWDATNTRWNYVGAGGSTVQTLIKRLDQVAAENREPNFFELLKAGILGGSLGVGSGTGNAPTFVAAESKYYDTDAGASPPRYLSSDYQIMQIGANIISQWDSSNIPIFIAFGIDPSGGGTQAYELAGIKNLPYLSKLVFKPSWRRISGRGGDPDTYQFDAWLLPSLWNPHQNAASGVGNVRITMVGTLSASTDTVSCNSITGTQAGPLYIVVDPTRFGTMTSPSSVTTAAEVSASSGVSTSSDPNPGPYYGFHVQSTTNPTTPPSGSSAAYPTFGSGCDFQLQVQVNGNWKTYQTWKGCRQPQPPSTPLKCQSPPSPGWLGNSGNGNPAFQDPEFVCLDPRTLRFGVWGNAGVQSGVSADYTDGTQGTLDWPAPRFERITALPPQGSTFASSTSPNLYLYANNADTTVRYTDLDAVQRLGDFPTGSTTAMRPSNSADRPLILAGAFQNGVFQSVAELGHVFRDQPWKTLTFTTASPNATARSGDAGLLDVFTLHECSLQAGKTSLNTRQVPVLKAILSQAAKNLVGTSVITSAQANNIVTALTTMTVANPMINKAELITRLAADPSVTSLGNKEARECVVRAFSDACQTRTWNLLIDVIAQTGRYPPNATSLTNGFVVSGEQRYWVHVAIDRFTGQVIDKQIEVVNE